MRIIIDTDPAMGTLGGDPEDCFAIMYALGSPEVTVEGIVTVQGNVPAEKGYSNAHHLMGLMGLDVPVRRGEIRPLSDRRKTQIGFLESRYGMDQIAEMLEPPEGEEDGVSFLIDKVTQNPGEITLVTIGPLTNVAAAMQTSENFAGALKAIVMMGGTAEVAGNIMPAAEFNFWQDPDAADIVFRSGVKLQMIGLDVCHQTHLYPDQVTDCAKGGSKLGTFVAEATAPWFKVMAGGEGKGSLHLYDSLAMAVAIDPSLVTFEQSYVAMEVGDGPAQGMSVSHHKPFQRMIGGYSDTNAEVALAVDVDRFMELFQTRVLDVISRRD